MKVSYAITVCNELEELRRLVAILTGAIEPDDEIVIQYDQPVTPNAVLEYIHKLAARHENVSIVPFALNGDFAKFKNHLNGCCKNDYIFQIDADEYPGNGLLRSLRKILANKPVDLLTVPRINIVSDMTPDHLQRWGWRVNEHGWVNFPDLQARIYRNSASISWTRKIHERLTGYTTIGHLPWNPEFALIHEKTVARQERQLKFYDQLYASDQGA